MTSTLCHVSAAIPCPFGELRIAKAILFLALPAVATAQSLSNKVTVLLLPSSHASIAQMPRDQSPMCSWFEVRELPQRRPLQLLP